MYTDVKLRHSGGASILPGSSRAREMSKFLELALEENKKLKEDNAYLRK